MTKNGKKVSTQQKSKPGKATGGGPARAMQKSRTRNIRNTRRRDATPSHIIKHGLNAFSDVHIPLPVSVGKYHTVRTVKTFPCTDYLSFLGPMRSTLGGNWRTALSCAYPTAATALNAATVRMVAGENPFSNASGDVECVPAAYSVQITGNSSLFSAAGVCYIGRMKNTYDGPLSTDARTASDFAGALTSYTNMRTVSNAELVSKPKQVSAIPTNMTEMQEFTPVQDDADLATFNWSSATPDFGFGGFAPICIVNPTLANLQITVCTEWRVRLDPFNPMHASGTHHKPTPPSVWHAITSAAESAGHGVEEVAGAAAGAYAISQGMGMSGFFDTLGAMALDALPVVESLAPLIML